MVLNQKAKGFTLIELMLVVAIVSLLAAIAIPKFAGLILKAKEASVKAKLGTLRSSFRLYYADNEGLNPVIPMGLVSGEELSQWLVPKYLNEIPTIRIPTVGISVHGESNKNYCAPSPDDNEWTGGASNGPWFLLGDWSPTEDLIATGYIGVNCTHRDSTGRTWSTW